MFLSHKPGINTLFQEFVFISDNICLFHATQKTQSGIPISCVFYFLWTLNFGFHELVIVFTYPIEEWYCFWVFSLLGFFLGYWQFWLWKQLGCCTSWIVWLRRPNKYPYLKGLRKWGAGTLILNSLSISPSTSRYIRLCLCFCLLKWWVLYLGLLRLFQMKPYMYKTEE